MGNTKKKNKANLRWKDTDPSRVAKTEEEQPKKKKMTFMQWVKISPIWYIVFGIISLGAAVYGVINPNMFASEGEASRITTLIVFFALGLILIYQGYRYIKDDEDVPDNQLFKMFTRK